MNRSKSKRLFATDITGVVTANRQQVDVEWRAGTLLVDEPRSNGGQDLGPDPFTMIVAGLVGCTLTTWRMYIRRKGWHIDDIRVHANMVQQQDPLRAIILRTIVLGEAVTDEQGEILLYNRDFTVKLCPTGNHDMIEVGDCPVSDALGPSRYVAQRDGKRRSDVSPMAQRKSHNWSSSASRFVRSLSSRKAAHSH